MWRWVHPETRRYYQADLVQDLFGDWTLVRAWGGLGTARGRTQVTGVASKEAGLRQVAALDRRRQQRGYRSVT
jgi:predicted DNA-binding WGR domain protein